MKSIPPTFKNGVFLTILYLTETFIYKYKYNNNTMSMINSFREWLGNMFSKYDEYKEKEVERLDKQIIKEGKKIELEKKRKKLRDLKGTDNNTGGLSFLE